MHLRRLSPSLAVSGAALFLSLGGGSYALASSWVATPHSVRQIVAHATAGNALRLGGAGADQYVRTRQLPSSAGEHFLTAGQSTVLGHSGHFTFSATCTTNSAGGNQVTFDVTADTTADLDGNGPSVAGTKVNIHTNSDALDNLAPGTFDQVGSASSSTEIAADGQEVDIFYNDGVNWPSMQGTAAHDCFAGYTGIRASSSN